MRPVVAAAIAVGRTYDPAFLQSSGLYPAPEPALAAEWYGKAISLAGGNANGSLEALFP